MLITAIVVIILYPASYILLTKEKYFPLGFSIIRLHAKLILFLTGIRKKVIYKSELPPPPYIICSNHSSYLDIFLSYVIFPDYFVSMGKKELGSVPLFNIFFKKLNILVDRKNVKSAHKALLRAGEEIRKGHGILLFPEGTIPKSAPQMKAFKNGAFRLAIEEKVPLIPVSFKNNFKLLQDSMHFGSRARPGLALVVIHEAVYTKGLNDSDLVPLREEVKNIIASEL